MFDHLIPVIDSKFALLGLFFFICNIDELSTQEREPTDSNITGSIASSVFKHSTRKFLHVIVENDVFVREDGGFTGATEIAYGVGPFVEFSNNNLFGYLNFLTKNLYILEQGQQVLASC